MNQVDEVGGWINLRPAVDPELLPPNGGRPGPLAAVGPIVPLCTWTPAVPGRRPTPPLVGIQHAAGGKAVPWLAQRGIRVPAHWRVVQDESRRGFVAAVPPDEGHGGVLDWLIAAGTALCELPFQGWTAAVYLPRDRARPRTGFRPEPE